MEPRHIRYNLPEAVKASNRLVRLHDHVYCISCSKTSARVLRVPECQLLEDHLEYHDVGVGKRNKHDEYYEAQ